MFMDGGLYYPLPTILSDLFFKSKPQYNYQDDETDNIPPETKNNSGPDFGVGS